MLQRVVKEKELVFEETPSGDIDGVNATFQTSSEFEDGTLIVYLNGLRQRSGLSNDYQIINQQSFSFFSAPLPGDFVLVDYTKK
jgi:hypothetical protein